MRTSWSVLSENYSVRFVVRDNLRGRVGANTVLLKIS